MLRGIRVQGARQHNLRDIDVEIPHNSLTVVTGLSGSGKSSLAFDTIYAEGQRRYVQTLSPYARQYLAQLERPDVDAIDGLSPALSIEQKSAVRNKRSTVGTVTEVYDYLRVLFSAAGTPYCAQCDIPIQKQTPEQIASRVMQGNAGELVRILAPVVRDRRGAYRKELEGFGKKGFLVARIDGELERLDNYPLMIRLNPKQRHTIEVVVDQVNLRDGVSARITRSVRLAAELANGLVLVLRSDGNEELYSEKLACARCGASVPEFEPRSFSFNSKFGACPRCLGLGEEWDLDLATLVPDPDQPFTKIPWPTNAMVKSQVELLTTAGEAVGIDLSVPWRNLPASVGRWLLHGDSSGLKDVPKALRYMVQGILPVLRAELDRHAGWKIDAVFGRDIRRAPCKQCQGGRLRPESLAVKIAGMSIGELAQMPIEGLRRVVRDLRLDGRKAAAGEGVLAEVRQRVAFLARVGVGYLWLNRASSTLSGGEAQRIRLATQIGTRLRGVLYVLDEPSIGLHARDHRLLLEALAELRDIGNTILVVEHDQGTIEAADFVLDLGPGAGRLGGEIVAQGSPEDIRKAEGTLTADYLSGRKTAVVPASKPPPAKGELVVRGARQHNLKDIDVAFPLGHLCVVTGVSGSGKSTLVNGILYPALVTSLQGSIRVDPGEHASIEGLQRIDKVIRINQAPIGRTPRSNPATYTGVFTPIREFYAKLPESRARGYKPGRFSFNVKAGRCDACEGAGLQRIRMSFLPDVFVRCEACRGKRFNRETLQVRYREHSIADLLATTVEESIALMGRLPYVRRRLQTLLDVGLGYLQLGQPSTTISGGEAQRIKLARELNKRQTGKTVYVLDEPTTGLHFEDVRKLLAVLRKLVDHGNTVIVIEHQLDVIRSADWIVDLGPEGGDDGGWLVCCGTPAQVAATEASHTGRCLREAGLQ